MGAIWLQFLNSKYESYSSHAMSCSQNVFWWMRFFHGYLMIKMLFSQKTKHIYWLLINFLNVSVPTLSGTFHIVIWKFPYFIHSLYSLYGQISQGRMANLPAFIASTSFHLGNHLMPQMKWHNLRHILTYQKNIW